MKARNYVFALTISNRGNITIEEINYYAPNDDVAKSMLLDACMQFMDDHYLGCNLLNVMPMGSR